MQRKEPQGIVIRNISRCFTKLIMAHWKGPRNKRLGAKLQGYKFRKEANMLKKSGMYM